MPLVALVIVFGKIVQLHRGFLDDRGDLEAYLIALSPPVREAAAPLHAIRIRSESARYFQRFW